MITKKHFIRAAALVNEMRVKDPQGAKVIADGFILLFKESNPAFQKQKFLKACGLDN